MYIYIYIYISIYTYTDICGALPDPCMSRWNLFVLWGMSNNSNLKEFLRYMIDEGTAEIP